MKHEKFCLLFTVILLCLVTGCASNRRLNRQILEYQDKVTKLENELDNRDRAIKGAIQSLRTITERSAGMEGQIDEVIELFDEYQRTVEQLLFSYRETFIHTKDTSSNISD